MGLTWCTICLIVTLIAGLTVKTFSKVEMIVIITLLMFS